MLPSPILRILRPLAVFLCLAPLAACSKLSGGSGTTTPTAPSGLPASGSSITYVGVGASDVLGIGSTSPCFIYEDCNGTGYVWVAARQLRAQGYTVSVSNVGIPAGVIGIDTGVHQIANGLGWCGRTDDRVERRAGPAVRRLRAMQSNTMIGSRRCGDGLGKIQHGGLELDRVCFGACVHQENAVG